MKKIATFIIILSFVSLANAQNTQQVTLKECYDLAVKQSETIAINDQFIAEAEALYGQARGSSLPEIYFGYDSTWQDRPSTTGSTPGSFFISPQTNTKIGIRKNLFTGYKELAAIKSGSNFVGQRKDEKNRALQLLLADVSSAFYGTLQAEADVAVAKKNFQLLQDRLKETKQRVSVGRNRGAEVAALESQVSTLEAQSLEYERIAQTQRQLLSFLAGKPITGELVPLEVRTMEMKSLAEFVNKIDDRPDVLAQEKAIDVANANIRLARSDHFPNIDMGANYYLDRQGFRADVNWDAIIAIEIPIWSWGATQKSVNAAKAIMNQQKLLARETKRRAEMDIQNAYRNVMSAREQRNIYEKASTSAEKEHSLTVRDYRSGLVSTFDVLETMNRLYDTERGLNLATLQARLAEVNLKIAAGYTPEEILQ